MRWTGLGLRDCRVGLANAEDILSVETDSGRAWVTGIALEAPGISPTRLLPGFDEFMLGYPADERAIDPAHHGEVVPGSNGVFKPTVIDCGRVVALWSRKLMTKTVRVEVTPLTPLDDGSRARIGDAAEEYADYVERPLEMNWVER
jgi:hypothetical protein